MIEIKQVKDDNATTFVSTSQSNSGVVAKVLLPLKVSFDPMVWWANSFFDDMARRVKFELG